MNMDVYINDLLDDERRHVGQFVAERSLGSDQVDIGRSVGFEMFESFGRQRRLVGSQTDENLNKPLDHFGVKLQCLRTNARVEAVGSQ